MSFLSSLLLRPSKKKRGLPSAYLRRPSWPMSDSFFLTIKVSYIITIYISTNVFAEIPHHRFTFKSTSSISIYKNYAKFNKILIKGDIICHFTQITSPYFKLYYSSMNNIELQLFQMELFIHISTMSCKLIQRQVLHFFAAYSALKSFSSTNISSCMTLFLESFLIGICSFAYRTCEVQKTST